VAVDVRPRKRAYALDVHVRSGPCSLTRKRRGPARRGLTSSLRPVRGRRESAAVSARSRGSAANADCARGCARAS
jgi:hypothetical protein